MSRKKRIFGRDGDKEPESLSPGWGWGRWGGGDRSSGSWEPSQG